MMMMTLKYKRTKKKKKKKKKRKGSSRTGNTLLPAHSKLDSNRGETVLEHRG